MVKIKTQAHLLKVSDVKTIGLDDDLNRGDTGDMEEGAMSRRHSSVWDDEEEDW